MIRFLQKPGPIKKIVLGGILLVICVMMVITLVPGGLSADYFGGGLTTQGVMAKSRRPGDRRPGGRPAGPPDRQAAVQGQRSCTLMPYLMQRAAQSMITQKMLVYEADRMGLGVSNDELGDASAPGPDGTDVVSRRQLHRRAGL